MPRGVKKGLDTKKFERCVADVKRKSGKSAKNPYAVCNASMGGTASKRGGKSSRSSRKKKGR